MESELLLLLFPTLRIQQLTLFGCKSWGFVIYNQFSALVSSALACPFFCSLYPTPKALTAFLCYIGPVPLPFSSLCLPPPHPSLHLPLYTAEARQVWPSCASSGSCLPWYIIREPRERRPTRSHNLCTSVSHMMLNIIDPLNKSTTQRALKQPFA